MHLPTLIIMTLLINTIIGIYLYVLYQRNPKGLCFLYWALSCFSFVIGGTAAGLREFNYPIFITYFVADFFLISAPILVFAGLIKFSRIRVTRRKITHTT